MVGVAEAGAGGGTGAAPELYYGEYYPPDHYYVTPDMCQHPQHPQHPHMCAMHSEYGGVGMGVGMMPPMMPPVLDESMRHYMLPHQQPPPHQQPHQQHQPPHQQPHQPPHQPPPTHHQSQHHYGGANGSNGPQQYYGGGGYGGPPPGHYHTMPPPPQHHLQPSPPPPTYHKDERTQRQYTKLKRRLDQKYNRNNGIDVRSGGSTPSLSPRKDVVNGNGSASGACSEGEGSSAGASLQGDDENTQALLDALSAERTPQVSELTPTSALVQWSAPTPAPAPSPASAAASPSASPQPAPAPAPAALPNMELTYELLLGDRDRYKAIYSGHSLSCRVRDLRPGTEYSLRLQIRAGGLTGAASSAATFRAPPAPPGAPPPARVTTRTRTTLLLRWGAAAENGARVLHYVVEMDAGAGYAEIAQPRTRHVTANNLQQQTEHRFRIGAVNECGRGPWSEESVAWTTGAPPLAPAPPALAAPAPRSLSLLWERRAPEEEFTLQMDDPAAGHGFLPVYSGRETVYECEKLRRASDYRFRLRCETTDGNGPWSPEVTYRTAPERPGPPGRPAAKGKIHSRAFRLRWDPPSDDGGAEVRSYTLELDAGEGFLPTYAGPEREATCDRLQPGTPYRARVNCETSAGVSEWSPSETITTEAVCPAACLAPELAGKPRASSVAVRWRPPETDGGAPISDYRVEVSQLGCDSRIVYEGLELECLVRDLAPGTEYELMVTAHNRVGAGAASPALTFSTAPAPPDSPGLPNISIEEPTSATLEWSVPNCNGAPIVDYRVEMSSVELDEGYLEIYRGAGTTHTVKKLVPSSPYFFRVCASNSAGRSPWSPVSPIVTPRAPPAAPSAPRYESTAVSLELFWKKPIDHGAEILRFLVQLADTVYETDGAVCSHVVEGLSPETVYRVRIAAVNELGISEWSEAVRASTRPPPPLPPPLECVQRAHNFLKIKWGEGTAPDTTQYCLEMRAPESRDFRPTYRGSARSYKVKKLRESTAYAFRIRVSDELGGRGPASEPLEAATCAAPPPAPRAPTLELTSSRCAAVAWDSLEPPLPGRDALSYVVQAGRGREPGAWRLAYAGTAPRATLDDLEPGGEYAVRVCGVRGGLQGAWSPTARLVVPAPPPPPAAAPRARRPRAPRALHERHTVWLMVGGFLAVAVAMALLVERFVERQDGP